MRLRVGQSGVSDKMLGHYQTIGVLGVEGLTNVQEEDLIGWYNLI